MLTIIEKKTKHCPTVWRANNPHTPRIGKDVGGRLEGTERTRGVIVKIP